MTHPVRLAVVALSLAGSLVAAHAQQRYSYFQAGISTGLMSVSADPDHVGATGWMIGYRFNKNVGVQVAGFGANNAFHQALVTGGPALYDFNRYLGVQAVGFIPATAAWDIYGLLGVGRSYHGTLTPGAGEQTKTDGLVGAGLRWEVVPHFALNAEIARLVDAQSTHAALRAEVDF